MTLTPWLSTFTRRWHCNPHLCHTVDPVAAHSARMAVLALQFWGALASRDLLAACLCHDLGEHATGDVPRDAKAACPELAGMLDILEGRALHAMGMGYSVSLEDHRRLKLLDVLDANLWAAHHAPHLFRRTDWHDARKWLRQEAKALGVGETLDALLAEVRG